MNHLGVQQQKLRDRKAERRRGLRLMTRQVRALPLEGSSKSSGGFTSSDEYGCPADAPPRLCPDTRHRNVRGYSAPRREVPPRALVPPSGCASRTAASTAHCPHTRRHSQSVVNSRLRPCSQLSTSVGVNAAMMKPTRTLCASPLPINGSEDAVHTKAYVLRLAFFLILVVASALPAEAAPRPKKVGPAFLDGQVLVGFQPGTPASARSDAHRQAGGRLQKSPTRSASTWSPWRQARLPRRLPHIRRTRMSGSRSRTSSA